MNDSTERIKKLREEILAAAPAICPERAVLWTDAYINNEDQQPVMKAALALKETLSKMTIHVYEDELLVGNQASVRRGAPLHPQINLWFMDELDRFDKREGSVFQITEETKRKLREIMNYWKGKTVFEKTMALLPNETKEYMDSMVFTCNYTLTKGTGHFVINFNRILKSGYEGIRKECEEHLAELELSNPNDMDKIIFYKAILVVCDAVEIYAQRYANEALRQAGICQDLGRKKELETIAKVCERVPKHPAETFYEAVQSTLFLQIISQIESDGTGLSTGRLDYFLYPYYEKDVREGRLTKEFAEELMDSLWLKMGEVIEVWNEEDSKFFGGHPISQTITLGGTFADGRDSTNELSYICLETTARIKMPQPSVCVRIHKHTPREFLLKCADVARLGLGMPAFYNDDVAIVSLMDRGVTLKHARENFAVAGCVEMGLQGQMCHFANSGYFSLLKALEVTLNDGLDPKTGKQVGPHTGDISTLKTYDDLYKAFMEQVQYALKHMVATTNVVNTMHGRLLTLPFISSFTEDCLGRGKEVHDGGALYNHDGPQGVGLADTADSLAAIKKLVYGEKVLELKELLEALKADFNGHELTRVKLIKDAPKFGNNDPYVDNIAREVASMYCETVNSYPNPRGGHFVAGMYSVSANVPIGTFIGASANGRKAYAPVADACSPTHGVDKNGPTQAAMSIAALDHAIVANGTQYNQKYHPNTLAGQKGLESLSHVIETFFHKGGYHIQFNVVSAETLRAAQKNPEKYRNVVVRVAGYTCFFVDLPKMTQDDVIDRTEMCFA
ncbi:MAG: pyruvate formate-lyase [Lachnospiraceae bacterium]|nr:pyruvate formate-lyase [Lachnospiraceae bacterium]